jgi:hypothetical protein
MTDTGLVKNVISYIFYQCKNVKLLTNTSCDFLSSVNVLTVDERRGIAMKHLTENETKIIQDMKVFKQYDFPAVLLLSLVRMYTAC